MITPHDIPKHARRVEYTAERHTGVYYVWRQGESWYWSASGNQGEKPTEQEAELAARRWIKCE